MAKKVLNFDTVSVGEDLGFADYTLTEKAVREFAAAVEDFHPWYFESSPFGGAIGPCAMSSLYPESVFMDYFEFPEGAIHAGLKWKFFNPVLQGATVRTHARIAEKYVRKGRAYVVIQAMSKDRDSGQPLLESWNTILLPNQTGDRDDG